MSEADIAHREVMHLAVPAARVHEFVMTPERILDYYPEPIEGGVRLRFSESVDFASVVDHLHEWAHLAGS